MRGAAFLAPGLARGVREGTRNQEGSFAPLWMTAKGRGNSEGNSKDNSEGNSKGNSRGNSGGNSEGNSKGKGDAVLAEKTLPWGRKRCPWAP